MGYISSGGAEKVVYRERAFTEEAGLKQSSLRGSRCGSACVIDAALWAVCEGYSGADAAHCRTWETIAQCRIMIYIAVAETRSLFIK